MDLVQAIDLIYLFRVEGDNDSAWKLGYQTEGSTEETREYESEPTKDGTRKSPGAYEGTHSVSSFMESDDKYVKKLKELVRAKNPERLEVWEIDRTDIDDKDTIPGDYSKDYVTSVNRESDSEGDVELEIETEVDGTIVSGEVEVTDELKEILQQISEEQEFVQPIVVEESTE